MVSETENEFHFPTSSFPLMWRRTKFRRSWTIYSMNLRGRERPFVVLIRRHAHPNPALHADAQIASLSRAQVSATR
jgi:hypothetical protein